jgi:hypothetical protein
VEREVGLSSSIETVKDAGVVKAYLIDIRPIFLQTNFQKETINKNDIKYLQSKIQFKLHNLKGNSEQILHKTIKMMKFSSKYFVPSKTECKRMNKLSAKKKK